MTFQNKTFFITGGTGFIGKALIKTLLSYGAKIYCYGRNTSKIENAFGNSVIAKTDFSVSEKIDYVIHAACPTDSAILKNNTTQVIDTIYSLTKQSLEFAKQHDARYLYLSSMEVYDGLDGYLTEENIASFSPSIPRNSYPIGKILSELLVNSYHKEQNLNTAIVRLSNIFGPGCNKESNKFFNYVIRQTLNNKDIVLKTTGNKIHNSCFIDDAVKQILLVLNSDISSTFNVTNEDYALSINKICEKIIKLTNSSSKVKHELEEGVYPKDSKHVISGQKIKSLFTFQQTDFENALLQTINYFKN